MEAGLLKGTMVNWFRRGKTLIKYSCIRSPENLKKEIEPWNFFFSPFLSGLLPKLEFQRVQVLGGDLTRGSLHFDVASIYNYIYGEAHRSANMEGEDNLFSLAVMIMSYCP